MPAPITVALRQQTAQTEAGQEFEHDRSPSE